MRLFVERFALFSLWVVIAMGALVILAGVALWFWPRIVCKVVAGAGIALGFFVIGSFIRSFAKVNTL